MINARSEGLRDKPAFREALRHKRCLVPASGFYEWLTLGPKNKQPMHIRRRDGRPFVFAGLWEEWGPRSAPTRTYSIITTAANELMAPTHDRMPVVLSEAGAAAWLETYALMSPDRAQKRVKFIDTYRSYVLNYNLGQDLVRAYVEKHSPSGDRWPAFKELLASPRLPGGLK